MKLFEYINYLFRVHETGSKVNDIEGKMQNIAINNAVYDERIKNIETNLREVKDMAYSATIDVASMKSAIEVLKQLQTANNTRNEPNR